MRAQYTSEIRNLAVSSASEADISALIGHRTQGPFWEILEAENLTLAVSREYEHFILLLGADGGTPVVQPFEMPHPSGIAYDETTGDLIVASTRTPHQIFFLRPLSDEDYGREILPAGFEPPEGTLFLPYRSLILPGTLYVHDIALMGGGLYATATGHNFLARIGASGGWERVWWPKLLDGLGHAAFETNCLQLNSIAVGDSPETSFYTAFADTTGGARPWKEGYGPKGRGVVFDGASREVLLRGLTCPHSARLRDGRLWLCNSGYGEVGFADPAGTPRFETVARLDGFTRGLAFSANYAFVGLSRVIDFYEPYAPGLDARETKSAVVALDLSSGSVAAMLEWPEGYQIYDVQVMPGVRRALLPRKPREGGDFNRPLRFLG